MPEDFFHEFQQAGNFWFVYKVIIVQGKGKILFQFGQAIYQRK